MITIFNRKELLVTFSMGEQIRVREILASHDIDYQIKTVSPYSCGGGRGHSASFGIDSNAAYQYYIYVHSKNYAQAKHLISVY